MLFTTFCIPLPWSYFSHSNAQTLFFSFYNPLACFSAPWSFDCLFVCFFSILLAFERKTARANSYQDTCSSHTDFVRAYGTVSSTIITDVSLYRARIGSLHAMAAALDRKPSFLDESTLIPFLTVTCSDCSDSLVPAVYVYFCLKTSTRDTLLERAYYISQSLRQKNSCLCDRLARQRNVSVRSF